MRFGGPRKLRDASGAIEARGHELRIAGEKAQKVDVLEHADNLAVALNREAALVVLRHPEERRRDEIVGRDRDHGPRGERGDRRIERTPVEDRGVHEVAPRDDAHVAAVAREEGVGLGRVHALHRLGDGRASVHDDGLVHLHVVDPRAEQRRESRAFFLARGGVELHRDIEVEEGREARVLGDQPHHERARQEMAERLFAGDEGVRPAALHEPAAVESVARAEQRHEVGAVALLDHALHHHEQAFGRRAARDDRLARAEIADIEPRADDIDLVRRQPVERRVPRIEMLRHVSAHPSRIGRALNARGRALARRAFVAPWKPAGPPDRVALETNSPWGCGEIMATINDVLSALDAEQSPALERLFELLKIPSISAIPAHFPDCERAADWLVAQLTELGFEASQAADRGTADGDGHGQGQDAATRRMCCSTAITTCSPPIRSSCGRARPSSRGWSMAPNGERIVARGAADDKGQLMTFVEACRAFGERRPALQRHRPVRGRGGDRLALAAGLPRQERQER